MDVDSVETSVSTLPDLRAKFVCSYCEKRFATRYSKKRHENNFHTIETDTSTVDSAAESSYVTKTSSDVTDNTPASALDEEEEENETTCTSQNSSDSGDQIEHSECDEEDHPFDDLLREAFECHHEEYSQLNCDDEVNVNRQKRSDFKRVSKTLRELFVDYILDMEEKMSTPLFKTILRKAEEYEEEGFDRDEAVKAAVDYRKFSIEKLLTF